LFIPEIKPKQKKDGFKTQKIGKQISSSLNTMVLSRFNVDIEKKDVAVETDPPMKEPEKEPLRMFPKTYANWNPRKPMGRPNNSIGSPQMRIGEIKEDYFMGLGYSKRQLIH